MADIGDLPQYGSSRKFRRPRSVVPAIITGMPESVLVYLRQLVAEGWMLYTTTQTRGYCNSTDRVITLPKWALEHPDTGHRIWYLCHEMAHAFDKGMHNHGPEFMVWLARICPVEHQHYEYGYKPRNARAAGLSEVGGL